jgi:thiol:disulfide interchange protein DsbC
VKYRIIVFTDVDCGYCRALHRNIDDITARGIEVHYVSYPRTGPNTESWTKAEHVWCARDRNTALTQAKLGTDAKPDPGCKSTPIATHYALGRAVGMTGTPAIYAQTGEDVGGYAEPDVLLTRLEKIAAAH